MSDGRSLLDWFGKRRESLVMRGLRDHALKVRDAVSELEDAFEAICSDDRERATDAIRRLLLVEKEADNLEEMIREELSKGDLDSRQREDLLHLTRRMDYAADWAKEAGMNLQLILEADVSIPKSLWGHYHRIARDLEEVAQELKASIDNLGGDHEEAIRHEREVERLEHVIDEAYFQTKKEILLAEMDLRAIFLMRDLLHGMENSADSCKDAADTIHTIHVAEMHRRK